MAFRNDIDALDARHKALAAVVQDRTRARDEAARMLDEARARERGEQLYADFVSGGPLRRKRRALLIIIAALTLIGAVIGIAGLAIHAHHRDADRVGELMRKMEQFADQM